MYGVSGVRRGAIGQKSEPAREAAAKASCMPFGPKFVTVTYVSVGFCVGIPNRITFRLVATRISGSTKQCMLLLIVS
jgi:hypothetical protein